MANERAKSRRRQTDKLFAEWFWTDRWTNSRGHTMPMEARGLYREMLTQAARFSGTLPNDHEAIRVLVNATVIEWRRSWPIVAPFWTVRDDRLAPLTAFGTVRPLPGKYQPIHRRAWMPASVREEVFAIHGKRCKQCGAVDRIEIDHIVPYSKGGPDEIGNYQPLCKPCNVRKGAR